MLVVLIIWNILLTACLVGGLFRLNDLQRQLDRIHEREIDLQLAKLEKERTEP